MTNKRKRFFTLVTVLAMCLTLVPMPAFTADAVSTPMGYNDHDFQKLVAFAQQGSNQSKLVWNLTSPGTWSGVTWSSDTEKRVTAIGIDVYGGNLTNPLTGALDVSDFIALKSLFVGDNALTAINVSGCAALERLNCEGNQLTALDVSGNTALEDLGCIGNQLTALDVSNNTLLKNLLVGGNQLTTLDVSNNTALTQLHCSNRV